MRRILTRSTRLTVLDLVDGGWSAGRRVGGVAVPLRYGTSSCTCPVPTLHPPQVHPSRRSTLPHRSRTASPATGESTLPPREAGLDRVHGVLGQEVTDVERCLDGRTAKTRRADNLNIQTANQLVGHMRSHLSSGRRRGRTLSYPGLILSWLARRPHRTDSTRYTQ